MSVTNGTRGDKNRAGGDVTSNENHREENLNAVQIKTWCTLVHGHNFCPCQHALHRVTPLGRTRVVDRTNGCSQRDITGLCSSLTGRAKCASRLWPTKHILACRRKGTRRSTSTTSLLSKSTASRGRSPCACHCCACTDLLQDRLDRLNGSHHIAITFG